MKLRRIIIVVVLLLAVPLCWHFYNVHREPHYLGKPFRDWFTQYYPTIGWLHNNDPTDGRHEEASKALRHMGTNAIPYLLDEALDTGPEPALRTNLYPALNELISMLPGHRRRPVFVTRIDISSAAAEAIGEIKPPADMILPSLTALLPATNTLPHHAALFLLGCVGDGAEAVVPYLITGLKESDSWSRTLAAYWLSRIGPAAAPAAPALIEAVRTNGANWQATIALGNIGPKAAPAVPVLQEFMSRESLTWDTRAMLAAALCKIDAGQTNALAFLESGLLCETNSQRVGNAAFHLGEIGPNARAAIPALLESYNRTNIEVIINTTIALRKLNASPAEIIPHVEPKLLSPDETVRVNAAGAILQVDPGHQAAQAVLLTSIKNHTAFWSYAMDQLARLGPAARNAVPTLRAIASTNTPESDAAARALKKIQSNSSQ